MMIEKEGSDLFLTTGVPPSMKAQGKVREVKEVMEKSEQQSMKTFDSALFDLYKQGKISYEETLRNADSKNNARLRIQLSDGKAVEEEERLEEEDDSGGLSLAGKHDEEPMSF